MRGPLGDSPAWVRAVFAALFLLGSAYFFLHRGDSGTPVNRIGADGRYNWAYLTSLILDRDVDFTNQYANPRSGNYYHYRNTPMGVPANPFTIGPAVFWTPSFLLGYAVARVAGADHADDGTADVTQAITLYASFLWAFLAMLLVYAAARRRYGPGPAILGALVAGCGGPVLHYALHQPHYAHATSAFATTLLLHLWIERREARGLRGWLALGAAAGLAMLVRPQNLIFALPAAVDGVREIIGAVRKREARRALLPLAGAAAAVVTFLPQMLAWRAIYGFWLGTPQGPGYMRWDASLWLHTLFGSRAGLVPYAPLWALGLVGLAAVARRERALGWALIGTFAASAYVNGAVIDWWGMGAFGARRFDGLFFAVGLGIATLARPALEWVARRPRAAAGLLIGGAAAALLYLNLGAAIDFQEHINNGPPEPGNVLSSYERAADRAARPLWRFGCPLCLPGAIAFWIDTGAPLSAYDHVMGGLPFLTGVTTAYLPLSATEHHDLAIGAPGANPYVVRGVGPGGAIGGDARILAPLNNETTTTITVRGAGGGRLIVRWNGDEIDRADLPPGAPYARTLTIEPRALRRGVNLLDLRAEPEGSVTVGNIAFDAPRTPPAE